MKQYKLVQVFSSKKNLPTYQVCKGIGLRASATPNSYEYLSLYKLSFFRYLFRIDVLDSPLLDLECLFPR